MHQEFAVAFRLVIKAICLDILRDVAVDEIDLVFADFRVRFFKRDGSAPKTFDFASDERDSAFEFFENLVAKTRLAVVANDAFDSVVLLLIVFFLIRFRHEFLRARRCAVAQRFPRAVAFLV